MMGANKAVRVSGDTKVVLVWNDRTNQWRADVSCRNGKKTIYVGRAPADRLAVDSPEAYDSAARAAVAFAVDEGLDCQPNYNAEDSQIEWQGRFNAMHGHEMTRLYETAEAERSLSLVERAKAHPAGVALGVAGVGALLLAAYYTFTAKPAAAAPLPAPAPVPHPAPAPAPRAPAPAPRPVAAPPPVAAPAPAPAPAPIPQAPAPVMAGSAAPTDAATLAQTQQGGGSVLPAIIGGALGGLPGLIGGASLGGSDDKSAGGPGYHLGLPHNPVFVATAPDGQAFTLFADGKWECATCVPAPGPRGVLFTVHHGGQDYHVCTDGTWQSVINLG